MISKSTPSPPPTLPPHTPSNSIHCIYPLIYIKSSHSVHILCIFKRKSIHSLHIPHIIQTKPYSLHCLPHIIQTKTHSVHIPYTPISFKQKSILYIYPYTPYHSNKNPFSTYTHIPHIIQTKKPFNTYTPYHENRILSLHIPHF